MIVSGGKLDEPERFAIVGYARTPYSDDEFRESAYESVKRYGAHPPEGDAWRTSRTTFIRVTGEFADASAIGRLTQICTSWTLGSVPGRTASSTGDTPQLSDTAGRVRRLKLL